MDEAEACRVRGNACFAAACVDDAIAAYRHGIDVLTAEPRHQQQQEQGEGQAQSQEEREAQQQQRRQLLLSLYSNLSNAYLTRGDYDASSTAARCATAVDARALKPWLRYVDARRRAGYAFDAFVVYLRHVLPRIRRARQAATAKATHALHNNKNKSNNNSSDEKDDEEDEEVLLGGLTLREVEHTAASLATALQGDLGVSQLSGDVELTDYAGGYALVSRRRFHANEVVFVERQYSGMPTLAEDAMRDVQQHEQAHVAQHGRGDDDDTDAVQHTHGTSTTHIALAFARYLRVEQQCDSVAWRRFRRDFCGAWPRTLADVDAETRAMVGGALRRACASSRTRDLDNRDSNNRDSNNNSNSNNNDDCDDELLVASLMCRYNCFHAGFFRVCALANHSCHANIAMKYASVDRTVTMVTVDAIAPGQLMNVKYLSDAHFLMGVGKRREVLRSWLFWCACTRCVADMGGGGGAAAAVQEHVRCATCARFVHLPLPGDGVGVEADPLLAWPTGSHNIDNKNDNEKVHALHTTTTLTSSSSSSSSACVRCCVHCGSELTWPEARRALLRTALQQCTTALSLDDAPALLQWLRTQLATVARVGVHPCHWLYRMLFYFCCIRATTLIDDVVRQVEVAYACLPSTTTSTTAATTAAVRSRATAAVSPLWASAGVAELYAPLLREARGQQCDAPVCDEKSNNKSSSSSAITTTTTTAAAAAADATDASLPSWYDELVLASAGADTSASCGHDGDSSRTGAELLHVFVVLWRLLHSFYPAQEMWAVHKAICWLVLLHLVATANNNSSSSSSSNKTTTAGTTDTHALLPLLSSRVALALLQRHAPYLGQAELRRWLHVYSTLRTTATTTMAAQLPSLRDVKQALRLNTTAMTTLTVYRNDDVTLTQPCRVRIPRSVDTLAELCRVITHHLASSRALEHQYDGDDSRAGRSERPYCFLYTCNGTPLWSVRACVAAHDVVASRRAGFVARHAAVTSSSSSSLSSSVCSLRQRPRRTDKRRDGDDTAAAAAHVQHMYSSNDDSNNSNTVHRRARAAAAAMLRSGTSPPPSTPHSPAAVMPSTATTTAAARRTSTTRLSIQLTTPLHNTPSSYSSSSSSTSSSRSSTLSSYSSSTSSDSSATTTSSSSSSSSSSRANSTQQASLYVHGAVLPLPAAARLVTTQSRQRHHSSSSSVLANTTTASNNNSSSSSSHSEMYARLRLLLTRKWHAAAALRRLPSSQLLAQCAVRQLYRNTIAPTLALPPPPQTTTTRRSNVTGTQREATTAAAAAEAADTPWRVCVSGPEGSGVSTLCAMLMQHMLSDKSDSDTTAFASCSRLYGCLLLPLDLDALCACTDKDSDDAERDDVDVDEHDDMSVRAHDATRAQLRLFDDLLSMFALVVQATVDAVVAHRPTLRPHVSLLTKLWMRLCHTAAAAAAVVTTTTTTTTAARQAPSQEQQRRSFFVHSTTAAAVLGHDVLAAWERYAQSLLPLLSAYAKAATSTTTRSTKDNNSCSSSSSRGDTDDDARNRAAEAAALRDAVLTEVYAGLPCHIASSLHFAGVVYVLDGVQSLTRVRQDALHRPYGDAGALLQALWSYGADTQQQQKKKQQQHESSSSSSSGGCCRCHVLVAWPPDVPWRALYLPQTSAHLHTIGLLSQTHTNNKKSEEDDVEDVGVRLPLRIRCGGSGGSGRGGVEYDMGMFMGAPGYVAACAALVRSTRTATTTAAAAASSPLPRDYVLRVDARDAADALARMSRLVHTIVAS